MMLATMKTKANFIVVVTTKDIFMKACILLHVYIGSRLYLTSAKGYQQFQLDSNSQFSGYRCDALPFELLTQSLHSAKSMGSKF